MMKRFLFTLLLFLFCAPLWAQYFPGEDMPIEEDDLKIGGDIFTDFSEAVEDTEVIEDERFYRFGRFFSFQVGMGLTQFDGNRGAAYSDENPSYSLGVLYFLDFQRVFTMGLAFSRHTMNIDYPTEGFEVEYAGPIQIGMLRSYFGYRYYVDTSNLGTAITYSNPYATGRLEYWYVKNKFLENPSQDDKGGGIGMGLGMGLEFPIELKRSYINLEFLYHSVQFHDKETKIFAPVPGSNAGYDDYPLNGIFLSYFLTTSLAQI